MTTTAVVLEETQRPNWRGYHTWGLVAIVAGIATIGIALPANVEQLAFLGESALYAWLTIAILMALFAVVAGHGVTGYAHGVLIDDRHRLSLSRLQMLLWTVLVLSAYLAAALANIGNGDASPLDVTVPSELWIAMGISTASLVAAPAALQHKARRRPGQVQSLPSPADARMADLFRGEETTDHDDLDLGKVQMFLFTVVLVVGYGLALGHLFATTAGPLRDLPTVDEAVVTLLAISHAGYLAKKALPTGPPPTGN